ATITGRALTPDGKPAAGARVSFQMTDGHDDEAVRQKLYRDHPRSALRTGPDGRFRLGGMFPGLEVWVGGGMAGSRTSGGSGPVMPKVGETVDVGDITLPSVKKEE